MLGPRQRAIVYFFRQLHRYQKTFCHQFFVFTFRGWTPHRLQRLATSPHRLQQFTTLLTVQLFLRQGAKVIVVRRRHIGPGRCRRHLAVPDNSPLVTFQSLLYGLDGRDVQGIVRGVAGDDGSNQRHAERIENGGSNLDLRSCGVVLAMPGL